MLDRDAALRQMRPYVARARAFTGWSFADVDVRPLAPPPPWDYELRARELALTAKAILDIGTGGGDVLARIIKGLSTTVIATEGWAPNVPVARRRLTPLGAAVVHTAGLDLPFGDATFDLVLDRHEALSPGEVARTLAPGGRILTQQVGSDDWPELAEFFPERADFGDHFSAYGRGFAAAGLEITDTRRHYRRVAFATLGDLVFMLLVSPWLLPDLDPERDIGRLLALEACRRAPEGIVLTESRYLIEAHKPSDATHDGPPAGGRGS